MYQTDTVSVASLQVKYGDTDSMFVHLPGRSREEAFRIGAEIAAAVTAQNPKPVKLQFEKARGPPSFTDVLFSALCHLLLVEHDFMRAARCCLMTCSARARRACVLFSPVV